jgi:sulfur-carrier protein
VQNEARITVLIPTPLRRFTAGEAKVVVGGSSVAEVLDGLEAAHPGIGERLRDDSGQLRRYVNVFVNGQNVRDRQGVDTPLSTGDEVGIIPAMAGGADA